MIMNKIVSISYSVDKGPTKGGGGGVNSLLKFYNDKYQVMPSLHNVFKDKKKPISRIYDKLTKKYNGFGYYLEKFANKIDAEFDLDDLLICHDINSAAALNRLNRRYVLVYHGQGAPLYEYSSFGKSVLTAKEREQELRKERAAFEGANRVVFPSLGASDAYLRTAEFDDAYKENIIRKTKIIYNTSNEIKLGKAPSALDEINRKASGRKIILTVSTLNSAKGVDQIPEALENIPNFKERFLWVLVSSKGNMKEIVYKNVQKANLCDSFHHLDKPLKQSELAHLYSASTYYMMMHRVSIFDLATLEAMSYGLIPILSPVGGNLEVDKNDNVLFTPITDINDDKDYLRTKSGLNKKVHEECFSSIAFLNNYKALAKEVG